MDTTRFIVDRICGRAELEIENSAGGVRVWLRMPELRGFETLLRGRPAEEISHLASRICAVCPWPHHLAATAAVEDALGITPPPAALLIRELGLLLSNLSDRFLLFYVLNAPDVLEGDSPDERSFFNLMSQPQIREALHLRTRIQRLLTPLSGHALHAGSVVVGGLSQPMDKSFLETIRKYMKEIRTFSLHAVAMGRQKIMPALRHDVGSLESLSLPMLGSVNGQGALTLWGGSVRYMQPDGSFTDMDSRSFMDNLTEEHADWTRCAFPRLKDGPAVSLDPDEPQGMYRVGPLPRINACDHINTPQAQKALTSFRAEVGRHPQQNVLYHWARFIEMIHCCERVEQILDNPLLLDSHVREDYITPRSGIGVARVEAPRGSLFYRVELDDAACVRTVNIITPTTQNNAAMNVSLTQAARKLCAPGIEPSFAEPSLTKDALHKLTLCLRAYDPCPACAVHMLRAPSGMPHKVGTAASMASIVKEIS